MNLSDAAEYVRTSKAPALLLTLIRKVREIFTFTQERANRLARYVRIVRDYKAGVMVSDIESRYGCSRGTVLRYARMAGLPKRPKSDDPERRAKIIVLSKTGLPQKEIAKACNCSIALVSMVEHEAGLARRK